MRKRRLNTDNTTIGFQVFMVVNYCLLILIALTTLAPFIYVLTNSLRPEQLIVQNGYQFLPEWDRMTLTNYSNLLSVGSVMLKAFGVSCGVTMVGTLLAVVVSVMFGYVVSRKDVPFAKGILLYAFIGGFIPYGLVAFYMQVNLLGLMDSYWSMFLPTMIMMFNILLIKTFFQEDSVIALEESARIDGANDFQVLFRVVVPTALPVIATVGLYYAVGFWNNFTNAALFVTDTDKYPVQIVLNQIINSAQFRSRLQQLSVTTQSIEGMRMAAVIIVTIPIVLVYPFIQQYFVKGVMIGSIKG